MHRERDKGDSQVARLGILACVQRACVAMAAEGAAQVCDVAPDARLPWMASVAPPRRWSHLSC